MGCVKNWLDSMVELACNEDIDTVLELLDGKEQWLPDFSEEQWLGLQAKAALEGKRLPNFHEVEKFAALVDDWDEPLM